MTSANPDHQRLQRLFDLVTREDEHLLADDLGIDRLESFGVKFARMQDTIVDKLIPVLLRALGEQPGAAIDNLARMERLQLVATADEWLAMRRLCNRLVHEYIDRPDDLAPALERACHFTTRMHKDFTAMPEYAETRLATTLTAPNRAR